MFKKRAFQNQEKDGRADELGVANLELAFKNHPSSTFKSINS
jgi:hypothetical protein